jgi:aspartate dehydrogenase
MRVGLLGFGAIGQQVAEGLARGVAGPDVVLSAVFTRQPVGYTDFDEFLASGLNVVVEAASASAVSAYGVSIVASGADLVVASSAALADVGFRERLEAACRANGARVYVPAGALCGVDALGAAAVGGLDAVSLRVVDPGVDADTAFSGPASEGALRFPSRLNVAATVALALGGDASVTLSHGSRREITLTARGAFGEFTASIRPEPRKDQLSHIVALSLLATLRELASRQNVDRGRREGRRRRGSGPG